LVTNEWRYFASTEGSYIEQETFEITPTFNVSAKIGDVTKTRSFVGVPKTGGWEVAEEMTERGAHRAEAVEMTTAKPLGMGLKDPCSRRRTRCSPSTRSSRTPPSPIASSPRGELRRHQLRRCRTSAS
jgi:hypothetical protein